MFVLSDYGLAGMFIPLLELRVRQRCLRKARAIHLMIGRKVLKIPTQL